MDRHLELLGGAMKAITLSLAMIAAIGGGTALAEDETIWTPIPNCGPKAPDKQDIIDGSPLWECSKAEFAKSQVEYEAGMHSFWSRLSESERIRLKDVVIDWQEADNKACTKRQTMDFGCMIENNYNRAHIFNGALAKCSSRSCSVDDLQ